MLYYYLLPLCYFVNFGTGWSGEIYLESIVTACFMKRQVADNKAVRSNGSQIFFLPLSLQKKFWDDNNNVKRGSSNFNIMENKKHILKKIVWGIVALVIMVALIQILVADKYQAQVAVIGGEGNVGLNPTVRKLDFGDLSGDASAARHITLNAGGMDTYIFIWKFGSISELMKLSSNNFIMKKGDKKELELSVYMPPSAPVGDKYTGWVWIFKVPKVW